MSFDQPADGPFFATWGPESDYIRWHAQPGPIGIVAVRGTPWPVIGEAHPGTWRIDPRGRPVAVYRLRIHGEWESGLWECWGREFRRYEGEVQGEPRLD